MKPMVEPNLRTIRLADLVFAAVAFAAGMIFGMYGLFVLGPENPDLGPFVFVLLGLPLLISPLIYVVGFLFLETILPQRSRRAQMTSGIISGIAYFLLITSATAASNAVDWFLELPQWLWGGTYLVLWLTGPLLVAFLSSRVERRLSKKPRSKMQGAS